MSKNRVGICGPKIARQIQCVTNRTPVVGSMIDEMEKYLFAGHRPAFPVKETKVDFLGQHTA